MALEIINRYWLTKKKFVSPLSVFLKRKERRRQEVMHNKSLGMGGGEVLTGTVYGDGNNKKHGNDIKIAYYYNTRPNTQQMGPAAAAAATLLRIVVLFPIFPTIYSWRGEFRPVCQRTKNKISNRLWIRETS